MEDRIQIPLEGNQTWIVRDALEATARMIVGQPCEMLGQVLTTEGKRSYFAYEETIAIQRMVSSLMGLPGNATGGVGWNTEGDILWDLYQVVRHRLAWDNAIKAELVNSDGSRNWSRMMGVSYDEPIKYGSEPLAQMSGADSSYLLTLNHTQARLLDRALKTVLNASVCHFDLAVQWPKTRDNGTLREDSRNQLREAMEEVACAHIGITLEQREKPEQSPLFGDLTALLATLRNWQE